MPTPAGAAGAQGNEAQPASKCAGRPGPGLYLTATPIGNLRDITVRALDILAAADAVACEDTRVTRKLMQHYGLKTPLLSYHEHNAERMRPVLLDRLAAGQVIALVADAGLPLISDPGYKLVREAQSRGLHVTCLPGASAPLTALVLSGLPTDRFLFVGFPPSRAAARRRLLADLATTAATLVFFESPRRLAASLADMAGTLGDREAAVGRELTKLFEEVRRDRLEALARHYAAAGPPPGEVVVVVAPPEAIGPADDATVDSALSVALARSSLRDAVAEVAAATGRPRREVYRRALALGGAGQRRG